MKIPLKKRFKKLLAKWLRNELVGDVLKQAEKNRLIVHRSELEMLYVQKTLNMEEAMRTPLEVLSKQTESRAKSELLQEVAKHIQVSYLTSTDPFYTIIRCSITIEKNPQIV